MPLIHPPVAIVVARIPTKASLPLPRSRVAFVVAREQVFTLVVAIAFLVLATADTSTPRGSNPVTGGLSGLGFGLEIVAALLLKHALKAPRRSTLRLRLRLPGAPTVRLVRTIWPRFVFSDDARHCVACGAGVRLAWPVVVPCGLRLEHIEVVMTDLLDLQHPDVHQIRPGAYVHLFEPPALHVHAQLLQAPCAHCVPQDVPSSSARVRAGVDARALHNGAVQSMTKMPGRQRPVVQPLSDHPEHLLATVQDQRRLRLLELEVTDADIKV